MSSPNIGQSEFNPEKISGEIINKRITELEEGSEMSIFNVLELNKYDKERDENDQ